MQALTQIVRKTLGGFESLAIVVPTRPILPPYRRHLITHLPVRGHIPVLCGSDYDKGALSVAWFRGLRRIDFG